MGHYYAYELVRVNAQAMPSCLQNRLVLKETLGTLNRDTKSGLVPYDPKTEMMRSVPLTRWSIKLSSNLEFP